MWVPSPLSSFGAAEHMFCPAVTTVLSVCWLSRSCLQLLWQPSSDWSTLHNHYTVQLNREYSTTVQHGSSTVTLRTVSGTGMADLLSPGEVIKPQLTSDQAANLLTKLYGLQPTSVKEFNSYDDRNFFFTVAPGKVHSTGRP